MRTIFSTCSVIICLAAAQPTAGLAQDRPTTAGEKAKQTTSKATQVVEDPAITAAVKSKLLADKTVSGLKIDVDTKDGVVTLNGSADTRAEAQRAVKLARATKGVKRVVNNLTVTSAGKPAATPATKAPPKKAY